MAIWWRLGAGATVKVRNCSIFMLDREQKIRKQKPAESIVPRRELGRASSRQMAAHFVFIKGADEEVGSRSHVWPDGGINFYFNESLEKFH